ncbi:hypothetical protein N7462_001367 [Penicillium macrosclerotiorum]|uniref:uncharacterized protein n=1 Tax=Penicillium macrosclerotiorum TaxID=303699 RepID=UPI00254701E0|nr:uncharacterized protein N7462_001367 [Penicillium macrosclerotiorum]KAJ5691944.1 hypothetical protein N7462_001367 [Penicillium macrosclerotiorum]
MSLVQHVSAHEGIDHDPASPSGELSSPVARQIHYDFLRPQPPVVTQQPAIPAYRYSTFKRKVQVIFTFLACCLTSGIVFGFAALKPILVSEGVFHHLCSQEDALDPQPDLCKAQDLRLNLAFTIASITANMSAMLAGYMLDRYGSRPCSMAGYCFLLVGSVLMSLALFWSALQDILAVGNFFLALGGTFIFVPSFQIANAFPRHAGSIVACITGAYDASAAVFLFYQMGYIASEGGLSPSMFFLAYCAIPALFYLGAVLLLPKNDYHSPLQLENRLHLAEEFSTQSSSVAPSTRTLTQLASVLGSPDERAQRAEREETRQAESDVWGMLHGLPAHKQMMTPWFWLITVLTALQMLRMNYFIATMRGQYEFLLENADSAARVNRFFDIALPLGGILGTPIIGWLLDRASVAVVLAVIVVGTTVVGVLNCVPRLWAAYSTVVLFVLLRPLYYSAMSDYATKVFGFATFGRVYGTIICISGIVNFSQYGLDVLTHSVFSENPTPINIGLAIAGFIIGWVVVTFVALAGRQPDWDEEDESSRGLAQEQQSLLGREGGEWEEGQEGWDEDEGEYGDDYEDEYDAPHRIPWSLRYLHQVQ